MMNQSPEDGQIKAALEAKSNSNEKEKLKNTGVNSDDMRNSIKNNTHERYYYFSDEKSDSGVVNNSEE